MRCGTDLTPDVIIHPRLAELIEHLGRTRVEFRRAVDAVPAGLREVAPAAGRWTVAEVVDHAATIERRVAGLITRAVRAAQDAGVEAETDETPTLASFPGMRVLDRTTRWPAPDIGHPTPGIRYADAVAALDASRDTLLAALRDVDGVALGAVTYPHPAMGELSMYQWIAFLGFHEGRHALQVEEISRALGEEGSS